MADTLGIKRGSVVSVVGCGGKTTLIRRLAQILSTHMRVGVAATTKMYIPEKGTYRDIFVRNHRECTEPVTENGIYYFADEIIPGKIHGFSAYMAAQAKSTMDVLLIEADGSRRRPLKGWAAYEPVIIDDTTLTIGVVTLKELGNQATEKNVHRMLEFERLTGAAEGDIVQAHHISAMVNAPGGMFKGSSSKKVLLVNQIESEDDYKNAVDFINHMELNVDAALIVSFLHDYAEIYKKKRFLKVAAVVLASGFGKRMKKNKLLIDIQGMPMIEYVLDCVDHPNFCSRCVVTADARVAAIAEKHFHTQVVFNDDPAAGQGHSVALGTANCGADCDGIMFFSGDLPLLRAETVRKLLDVFDDSNRIVVPVYDGRRGNPVIFPIRFRDELMHIDGDFGGRKIIDRYPDEVVLVPVDDSIQGFDIDTPEDLERVQALMPYESQKELDRLGDQMPFESQDDSERLEA